MAIPAGEAGLKMDRNTVIGELLTRLEREEVQIMEWGFFDGVHTADEIAALFLSHPEYGSAFSDLAGAGAEALFVDDLASAGLLQRVGNGYPSTYRSRFAESARLFVRLRQRFREDDWAVAPELVSEARFHLAPRRFPVREIGFESAWEALESNAWHARVQREVLRALCATESDRPLALAGFQIRAAQRILGHFRHAGKATGTVVTAGTGGGKTKAFYIPALMGIAAEIAERVDPSTKVLAIYPRNVLLEDQFSEATHQAMVVNRLFEAALGRPIRIGAMVGDVPLNANFEGDGRNRWALEMWDRARGVEGHIVPHLRDPETRQPLVWLDADRRAGRTTLRLAGEPNKIAVPDGVVVLTREDLSRKPPDVLLTSIEMINKELSAEMGRNVLGFGTGRSALRLILLDEIHTYEGLTGAQVPWILRRLSYWTSGQRRNGSSVHVVGLSATLQDAASHLATLTGVPESNIEEICPDPSRGELTTEGHEYNVVLKSHPASGAGVLATSIQSVMLGARILTPRSSVLAHPGGSDAGHFFGKKLFGFTDNLDVVNRWLPDFCDAEQKKKLAKLRAKSPDDERRWIAGQAWRLSEELGHNLRGAPLRVTRTSSQDPGVDARADVVLATSALEVGFDDDEVGMVVQHKAPRSAASFLQRKGRAGRRKGMRPWTVVVLSDHGRDRWAFRDSERLFSPSLERLSLPVFNPYVLRIQATWFLVDWIAKRVGQGVPSLYLGRRDYFDPEATRVVRGLVSDATQRDELTRDLANWFRHAQGGVRLTDPEAMAQDILWKPPRAVLRHVVPVLWNFLEGDPDAVPRFNGKRLLPQFLPERTWAVLDAQDVELYVEGNDVPQSMDARRALRECVPGRVSRRYAVEKSENSKWLSWSPALLEAASAVEVPVEQLLAEFTENRDLPNLTIYQPTCLKLVDVPDDVKKSSNAEWNWHLRIERTGAPGLLALHTGPLARSFIEDGATWLHRERSWLRVYRYASGARYEILQDQSRVKRGQLTIASPASDEKRREAAVGFVRAVDGIELRLRNDVIQRIPDLTPEVLAALKPIYLRYLAMQSDLLRDEASVFGINQLVTSALGMIVATALKNQLGLEAAWNLIPSKAAAAVKVMQSVLANEADDEGHSESRGVKDVAALWASASIALEMDRLVTCLWRDPDDNWRTWVRKIFLETLRASIESAVQSLLPEVPESDFSVEVLEEAERTSIFILEADAGGVGIIDRLIVEASNDAALFDTAIESALTHCRGERIADNTLKALGQVRREDSHLRRAFQAVRGAASYSELQSARTELTDSLLDGGCDADKEAVTALVGKALMPGSTSATDRWIRRLTTGRFQAMNRLNLAVDSRVWAYWTVSSSKRRRLMLNTLQAMHGQLASDAQLTQSVTRLTLEPCRDSCPECLGTGKELHGLVPSRRIARQWLNLMGADIAISVDKEDGWLGVLDNALVSGARIRLHYSDAKRDQVAAALVVRLARQYDRGFALASFRIIAVTRVSEGWETQIRVDDMELT
ncbi:protein DpdJ [Variovorax sp. J22R133]|uniref:protein DpdJ n=1 Tax=Variovorax brevis TaxID=3053503 RepID=UPI0025763A44|nr:protein DpdJ [Variovorax sp. J22R133]MDM0117523.1 protein DpdJ [Variovorax sp. J22R133]